MKKIPVKNYVIAVVIILLTLVLTFWLSYQYKNSQNTTDNYILQLSEILPSEVDNYIIDNGDIVIYVTDRTNLELDKKVESRLTKSEQPISISYLNLNGVTEDFYVNFKEKYHGDIKPYSLIIIKENRVIKIIDINKNNVKKLEEYINLFYGV